VSGFLPPDAFFEMLANRMFPTTTWLRGRDSLEYTPEPDIFHDVFGHVPMHAHPVFGDFLQHYGQICAGLMHDPVALAKMGRVFWFTVEFGVISQGGKLRVLGSGLISLVCTRVLEGGAEIRDFDVDKVMNQSSTRVQCSRCCMRWSRSKRSTRRRRLLRRGWGNVL
jgi:phenylalanine-4-hydroxylase